eukprot:1212732-Heterocapsa_arctica.AAC.1
MIDDAPSSFTTVVKRGKGSPRGTASSVGKGATGSLRGTSGPSRTTGQAAGAKIGKGNSCSLRGTVSIPSRIVGQAVKVGEGTMCSLRGTTMSYPSRTIKCPEKWLPK